MIFIIVLLIFNSYCANCNIILIVNPNHQISRDTNEKESKSLTASSKGMTVKRRHLILTTHSRAGKKNARGKKSAIESSSDPNEV